MLRSMPMFAHKVKGPYLCHFLRLKKQTKLLTIINNIKSLLLYGSSKAQCSAC